MKTPEEGGVGLRDPCMAMDARKIDIIKKLVVKDRAPWMRWAERVINKIAVKWNVEDVLAASPRPREIKRLKDISAIENAIKIWHEIRGERREEKYTTVERGDLVTQRWESGYGMVQGEDKWIPIEDITSKVVYEKLLDTRRSIREYTPNPAHKVLCEIDPYLTPEERNYWWKLTHRLISTKKTESKYKRNEQGETVEPTCPVCQEEIETL